MLNKMLMVTAISLSCLCTMIKAGEKKEFRLEDLTINMFFPKEKHEIIIKKRGMIINLEKAYFAEINFNRILVEYGDKREQVKLFNIHPKYTDLFLLNDFELSNGQVIECGQIRFIDSNYVYIRCPFARNVALYYVKVDKKLLTGDFKKYFCKPEIDREELRRKRMKAILDKRYGRVPQATQ